MFSVSQRLGVYASFDDAPGLYLRIQVSKNLERKTHFPEFIKKDARGKGCFLHKLTWMMTSLATRIMWVNLEVYFKETLGFTLDSKLDAMWETSRKRLVRIESLAVLLSRKSFHAVQCGC
eukprot:jgi/Botrbrau1/15285/Bobra.97_1s0010.1